MAINVSLLNSNNISNINTNFQRVAAALADSVGRTGTLPNQMNADLDMNNNDLLNVSLLQVDDLTFRDGESPVGILAAAEAAVVEAEFQADRAEAIADSVAPGTVLDGAITNAKVVGFGATSPKSNKLSFEAPVASPALRTIQSKLWDKPSIRDFDLGGGDGNAAAAMQAAINEGATYKKAVYIPAGDFVFMSGVTIQSQFGIVGDGPGKTRLFAQDMNSPLFSIQTNGASIEDSYIENIEALGYFTSGAVAGSNLIFARFSGTPHYLQHNRYRNLLLRGFPVAFQNAMPTATTSFGQESYAAWQRFDNIRLTGFSRPCIVGWDYKAGSGTGNVWDGIQSNIGGLVSGTPTPGTLLRMAGTGCVVGDIILSNSHLGGYSGSVVLEGSTGTVYRQRIGLYGNQYDAGIDTIFNLDTTGAPWTNIICDDNNIGGNALLSNFIPAIRNSKIADQETGQWLSGKFRSSLPSGGQTLNVFDVSMGAYDGTMIEVVASGLVQGVASGAYIYRALIASGIGGVGTVTPLEQVVNPAGNPNFMNVTVTGTSYGARVAVSLNPTGTGSYIDTQIRASSGNLKIVRL